MRRVGDGHPPLRPALPLARATRSSARKEVYETYYDIRYPGHERQAGRPLRISSAYPWHARARRRVRREVRLGARQLVRVERAGAATSRCARAAGRGCTGRRRSAPSTAPRASAPGLFDESSFAKLEIAGPGRGRASSKRLCDNRVARDVGAITYTQMLNRRGGIECDFTVTRVEEELFSIVTGTAFGNHDLSWIRRHAPGDGSVRCTDVTARWACFALWGPRAREILAPLTADPLDFPLHAHARARRRRRAGARAAGDVRRRARLGAVLPDRVRRRAVARRCGRPGASTGCVAGGYRAIDSLRLEKGYRVWAADITARRDAATRPGSASASKDGERSSAPPALGVGAPTGRRSRRARLRCLVLEDPRSVALGNEPVRDRRRGRRARHQRRLRLHGRALDRLRLPARRASSIGTAVEVDIFGQWVAGEVAREPLFDPKGERVRNG